MFEYKNTFKLSFLKG